MQAEGKVDPFVELVLQDPTREEQEDQRQLSTCIPNEPSPRWGDKFDFIDVSPSSSLLVTVWDKKGSLESFLSFKALKGGTVISYASRMIGSDPHLMGYLPRESSAWVRPCRSLTSMMGSDQGQWHLSSEVWGRTGTLGSSPARLAQVTGGTSSRHGLMQRHAAEHGDSQTRGRVLGSPIRDPACGGRSDSQACCTRAR